MAPSFGGSKVSKADKSFGSSTLGLGSNLGSDGTRVGQNHNPPSPLPLFLEEKPRTAFPDGKKEGKDAYDGVEVEHGGRVDKLLQRVNQVLDGDIRVRNKKMELSIQMQRARSERRRQYELSKENPPIPEWVAAAEKHKGERPLKSLDEWLGHGGPKVRTSARELDKQPTGDSYVPRQMENHSQYDSELRANQMARNSEKLRQVEERLDKIYEKAKFAGTVAQDKNPAVFAADEVLAKLSSKDLESVHDEFANLGGKVNLTEFTEIMLAHLPRHEWKDQNELVKTLMDLYVQLDLNGDGVVTWEEMFEFAIETGRTMSMASEKLDDVILSYYPSRVQDHRGLSQGEGSRVGIKDGEIERMEYLAMMDKVAVIEKDSPIMKLYDAETLELTDCLAGHKGAVLRCLHLEGTDYIVSSGADACLIFWGAYTNNQRQILPCGEMFMSLVWDHTRRILYAGSSTGNVHLYKIPDVKTETNITIEEIQKFAAHGDVVTDMLALPDLGILVTASLDSRILVWDLAIHLLRRDLNGHKRGVYSLAYIPSQRYLISAGYDHNCKVWNPMIEEPLFTMHGHTNVLAGLRVVLGTNRVITSDIDAVVKVWDIRNFMCVQTIKIEQLMPASVTGITYIGRLDRIVVAGVGHLTRRVHRMFCLDYEHPAKPELADEDPLVRAIYSAVNNTITTASIRTIRVWNASTGLLWKTFPNVAEASITAICFDNRERKLIIGDESGQIAVYNYLNGAVMKKLDRYDADVCALAYCPFSKCIVSGSWAGKVRVHHDIMPDKTRTLRQIEGHTTDVTCMVYSVNMCLIATACTAGSVRLWDYQDVKLASSCQAHTTEITLLYFLDEYRLLLTGDFLGNLILWTVAPWRERFKPVCRFEYIIKEAASEGPKRDTPTCAVFHSKTHTLYIGGAGGEVIAFDTSAVLDGLLEWQGVDESGKRLGGRFVPPLPPRQFVRNPREGRTRVPEHKGETTGLDSIIKASGDVNVDIAENLVWGKDVMTGQTLAPRLSDRAVQKRFGWVAHEDAIKSIELIDETFDSKLLKDQERENFADSTFLTSVDASDKMGKQGQIEFQALLTSSTDHRVCLWKLEPSNIGDKKFTRTASSEDMLQGQLRQGDRDVAKHWNFPITPDMLPARQDNGGGAQQLQMKVI